MEEVASNSDKWRLLVSLQHCRRGNNGVLESRDGVTGPDPTGNGRQHFSQFGYSWLRLGSAARASAAVFRTSVVGHLSSTFAKCPEITPVSMPGNATNVIQIQSAP